MTFQDYTDALYEEVEKVCDLSLYWDHPDFHCFQQFSPETRMWFAMTALEAQISNGGLTQLLWNTNANWRFLLIDTLFGYRAVGAKKHADAIIEVICFFNKLEIDLFEFQQKLAPSAGLFHDAGIHPLGGWGESLKQTVPKGIEDLFYDVKAIDPLKCAVLDVQFDSIINEIRSISPLGNK